MKVIKRNGKKVAVNFNKIQDRIKKQSYGLNGKYVDPIKVAQRVINSLRNEITTQELDELAASTADALSVEHPDYSLLASRIAITSLHKETSKSFLETIETLYANINPKTKKHAPLVSDELLDIARKFGDEIDSRIDYNRDLLFNYFGYKTLEKSYLLRSGGKTVERPQHMWMRVALGLWGTNFEEAFKTYDLMSTKQGTHATPTLFNSGTRHPQLSSCFLLMNNDDSIEGLWSTMKDVANISKWSGGIGLAMHNVRAAGSYINGTGGESLGLVPACRTYNEVSRWIDQGGGKRKGSFAIYIEPWHADAESVLELKLNHGKEEQRARDLFYAMWIPDLFMERVQNNEDWTLMSNDDAPGLYEVYGAEFEALYTRYEAEGRGRKTLKARDLYDRMLTSQMETGTPYMLYKDAANQKSNQKNLGTIKSSNLCVAPETKILTKNGHFAIKDLADNFNVVEVWNGKEFSKVYPVKTGEAQPLLHVEFSNGQSIDCTPYHKFYVQEGYLRGTGKNKLRIHEKRANELVAGDKLIKLETPVLEFTPELDDAYTQGLFSGDGCSFEGKNHIDLYGEKMNLLDSVNGTAHSVNVVQNRQRVMINSTHEKFMVPSHYSVQSRLEWLAGFCDADATIARNGENQSLQLSSTNKLFLQEIQFMLQTLGVQSKVTKSHDEGYRMLPDGHGSMREYYCQATYRLLVNSVGLQHLVRLGFKPNRLVIESHKPNRDATHFIKVVSVENKGRISDTYCVNEPKEHKVVFNGIITGNCTEIIEYTDADEQAVCNLASLSLPAFLVNGVFDHQKLWDVTYQFTKNLNRVIDINYYPTEGTRKSNMRHRPIGLGVQGLADAFAHLRMAFDSPEAKKLNKDIFETIYHAAMTASCDLAKVEGAYETFQGSPLSQGIFQFDMWEDRTVEAVRDANGKSKMSVVASNPIQLSGRWDWETLRENVKTHGVRNSLLVAPMPTASTSQIMGNNECFEPYTAMLYKRNVLSGEFVVICRPMVEDLIEEGLWTAEIRNTIISNDGSIQSIKQIPQQIRDRYKTVWEIKTRDVIDMSADRGAFICQSQSLNLFIDPVNKAKITTAHQYGWLKGLKTGQYYLRTKAKGQVRKALGGITAETAKDDMSCSLDTPDDCLACGS